MRRAGTPRRRDPAADPAPPAPLAP